MDGGEVQALTEHALVGGAVTEEAGDHAVCALDLLRQRRAGRETNARADHAVGAQHADVDIGDMHAAALGDHVAVAAVRTGDKIRVVQARADARGHRLLTDGQMYQAGDIADGEGIDRMLLKAANAVQGDRL